MDVKEVIERVEELINDMSDMPNEDYLEERARTQAEARRAELENDEIATPVESKDDEA